jgi:hypothetical protein
MNKRCEEKELDLENTEEYFLCGCKVRLHFVKQENEKVQQTVLRSLLNVMERKKQDATNVQNEKSHLRHA